jgi:hypothetical protein
MLALALVNTSGLLRLVLRRESAPTRETLSVLDAGSFRSTAPGEGSIGCIVKRARSIGERND